MKAVVVIVISFVLFGGAWIKQPVAIVAIGSIADSTAACCSSSRLMAPRGAFAPGAPQGGKRPKSSGAGRGRGGASAAKRPVHGAGVQASPAKGAASQAPPVIVKSEQHTRSPETPLPPAPASADSLMIGAGSDDEIDQFGGETPVKGSGSIEESGGAPACDSSGSLGECVKCLRQVMPGSEGSLGGTRSKQIVHGLCVTAYKRRSRTNKTSKKLRDTWDALSVEEKADWFIKNTADGLGEDDIPDDISHQVTISETRSQDLLGINAAVPFAIFEERGEMRNWKADRILQEWKAALINPKIRNIKYMGVVCICRFEGVQFVDRQSHEVASSFVHKEKVSSAEDMETARAKGQEALDSAAALGSKFLQNTFTPVAPVASLAIPDDLIEGLIDDTSQVVERGDLLMDLFEQGLTRQARRDELLDALMKEDLVEASIWYSTHGPAPESEQEIAQEASRFRVGRAQEFARVKDVFSLSMQELQTEAVQASALGASKIGKKDEACVEAFKVLDVAKPTIDGICEAYIQKVDALKAIFDNAKTADIMKDNLQTLRQYRTEAMRDLGPLRKAMIYIRAAVKKQETVQLKGLRHAAEKDDSTNISKEALASAALEKYFTNHFFHSHGDTVNCINLDGGFDRMKPVVVKAEALTKLSQDVKFLPTLVTWLRTQMNGKDTASAALEKPKHFDQLRSNLVKTLTTDAIFEKPTSVLHDCLQSIFVLSVQVGTAKYSAPGFMPYGLGQWFVPIEGQLLIVGVQCQKLQGHSFAQKLNAMMTAKGEDLEGLVLKDGFASKVESGCAMWVPPGFVCLVLSLADSSWLRWSSMTKTPSASDSESRQVLSSSTMMISSYPVLGASYKEWLRFLEVSTASTST